MNHIPTTRKTALDFAVLTAPECPSCPSNTADLPAGSLLPSIPNKPENRCSSDPIRQKIKKKTTPFFNAVPNQKKDGQQERDGVIRRNSRKKSKTAAITRAIKKRLTGNFPPALQAVSF